MQHPAYETETLSVYSPFPTVLLVNAQREVNEPPADANARYTVLSARCFRELARHVPLARV